MRVGSGILRAGRVGPTLEEGPSAPDVYDSGVLHDGSTTAAAVGMVEREALLRRLHDHRDVPVVLLRAGAGFGKSSLASQWADADPRPHAVVRIARFLDDPAALALRLIDALESIVPAGGDMRAVVTGAEPGFSALLLPALTSLAASREREYVLVVDDVHLLTRPECHVVLQAVADGLPEDCQLALLTREEPPAWLARTRGEGRLLEFGPADLAFDEVESLRLLAGLGLGASGTGAVATDLVERAEGWPVGLYLMALSILRRRERVGAGSTSVSHPGRDRFVVDYLRAEVLADIPDPTREFLRRTSILDELDAPLCDAVLERDDSATVLSGLGHQLALVVALDPEGRRYRYHHLLVDALLAELEEHEPWLAPELHLRASSWFEARGGLDPAIRHAKAAGHLERAGALVWAGVPACIASGHPDRLSSWLADLDDVQIRSERWLTLAAAWLGLQTGDPDRMTRWRLAAEAHAGWDWRSRIPFDEYAASLAAIVATICEGGLRDMIELCRGVQRGLPPESGFRAAAFLNEGIGLTLTGRLHDGQASLQQAEHLGRALGVHVIEANALAWQGMLALLADDWATGGPLIARAGDLVQRHGLDRLATSASAITALALLQAARGSKDEARVTLGTARRLTGRVRRIAPWFAVAGPLVQARAAILLGDGGLARTLCIEAKAHLGPDLADTLLGEYLADAELRVLQFLPSRLTFQQIGEHLFLSQTTIKTHAQSIYRKLAVSSRDEAVARARSLGLVESPPGS